MIWSPILPVDLYEYLTGLAPGVPTAGGRLGAEVGVLYIRIRSADNILVFIWIDPAYKHQQAAWARLFLRLRLASAKWRPKIFCKNSVFFIDIITIIVDNHTTFVLN
jgi:hypothetical protein